MKYNNLYLCQASISNTQAPLQWGYFWNFNASAFLFYTPVFQVCFCFYSILLTEVYPQRIFFFLSQRTHFIFFFFLTHQDATLWHAHKILWGQSHCCEKIIAFKPNYGATILIQIGHLLFLIKVSRAAFLPSWNVTFLNTDKYRQSQYILLIIAFHANVSFCRYRALEDVALCTLGYVQ